MSRATVVIRGRKDREKIARWAAKVPEGTTVDFKAPRRSSEANAKLWANLTDIAQQVEWYGQKLSAEDWKDILSASLRKARVVPGIDSGTFVPLGMRTSDMTKQEFALLLDLVEAFGAQQGVTFSDHQDTTA